MKGACLGTAQEQNETQRHNAYFTKALSSSEKNYGTYFNGTACNSTRLRALSKFINGQTLPV